MDSKKSGRLIACDSCRGHHKKCDDKIPCSRCVEAGIADSCNALFRRSAPNAFSPPELSAPLDPMNAKRKREVMDESYLVTPAIQQQMQQSAYPSYPHPSSGHPHPMAHMMPPYPVMPPSVHHQQPQYPGAKYNPVGPYPHPPPASSHILPVQQQHQHQQQQQVNGSKKPRQEIQQVDSYSAIMFQQQHHQARALGLPFPSQQQHLHNPSAPMSTMPPAVTPPYPSPYPLQSPMQHIPSSSSSSSISALTSDQDPFPSEPRSATRERELSPSIFFAESPSHMSNFQRRASVSGSPATSSFFELDEQYQQSASSSASSKQEISASSSSSLVPYHYSNPSQQQNNEPYFQLHTHIPSVANIPRNLFSSLNSPFQAFQSGAAGPSSSASLTPSSHGSSSSSSVSADNKSQNGGGDDLRIAIASALLENVRLRRDVELLRSQLSQSQSSASSSPTHPSPSSLASSSSSPSPPPSASASSPAAPAPPAATAGLSSAPSSSAASSVPSASVASSSSSAAAASSSSSSAELNTMQITTLPYHYSLAGDLSSTLFPNVSKLLTPFVFRQLIDCLIRMTRPPFEFQDYSAKKQQKHGNASSSSSLPDSAAATVMKTPGVIILQAPLQGGEEVPQPKAGPSNAQVLHVNEQLCNVLEWETDEWKEKAADVLEFIHEASIPLLFKTARSLLVQHSRDIAVMPSMVLRSKSGKLIDTTILYSVVYDEQNNPVLRLSVIHLNQSSS